MRERKFAVERVLVVQQNKRVNTTTRRITASLALVFVNVNPALVNSLFENRAVLLAHRCQRLVNLGFCLLEVNFIVNTAHNRHIQIIRVQFGQTERFFSDFHIPVH